MSEREASRQLDGRVEIDDAYLGGELPGGKTGRGVAEQGGVYRGRANHRKRASAAGVPEETGIHQASHCRVGEHGTGGLGAGDLRWPVVLSGGHGLGAIEQRIVTGGGAASVGWSSFARSIPSWAI